AAGGAGGGRCAREGDRAGLGVRVVAGLHGAGGHPARVHPAGRHPTGRHPAGRRPAGVRSTGRRPGGLRGGRRHPAGVRSGGGGLARVGRSARHGDGRGVLDRPGAGGGLAVVDVAIVVATGPGAAAGPVPARFAHQGASAGSTGAGLPGWRPRPDSQVSYMVSQVPSDRIRSRVELTCRTSPSVSLPGVDRAIPTPYGSASSCGPTISRYGSWAEMPTRIASSVVMASTWFCWMATRQSAHVLTDSTVSRSRSSHIRDAEVVPAATQTRLPSRSAIDSMPDPRTARTRW